MSDYQTAGSSALKPAEYGTSPKKRRLYIPRMDRKTPYTYADYKRWNDGKRYELIRGKPRMMSGPTSRHQGISGLLYQIIANYLKGKECMVFSAPFDVRLKAKPGEEDKERDKVVVQPDIVVICDRKKLYKGGCKGAPDLVIEILSESTRRHDYVTKRAEYLDVGVKEYWIVDPKNETVEVSILQLAEDGYYYADWLYDKNAVIPVAIFDNLAIDMKEVFIFDETGWPVGRM
jgi:Uma2 family endonuclease